jgi:inorganic pyrophosphatase
MRVTAKRTGRTREAQGATGAPPPASPELPSWNRDGLLQVLVDTPRGSVVKFKLDLDQRCYTIGHILPPGALFPYDFGSIPSTRAGDGDPLDVLVLMEAPTFPGCLVPVRLVGALEAKQTQDGRTMRNDRLIGVSEKSRRYAAIRALADVAPRELGAIEHFFVSYNEERGRRFRVLRRVGPAQARRLVAAAEKAYRRETKTKRLAP